MGLALIGPVAIAWASVRYLNFTTAIAVRAIGLAAFTLLVVAVAAVAFSLEKLPAAAVGIRRPSWITVLRAVILTLFFIFVFGPVASWMLNILGGGTFDAGRAAIAGLPGWYLVLAVVAVAAGEEWLYRGYAIGRLEVLIGSRWLAGGISLLFFAVAHWPVWGWPAAATTVVSGAVLTVLYIRYRDVLFLILAHVATDLYGLILAPAHGP